MTNDELDRKIMMCRDHVYAVIKEVSDSDDQSIEQAVALGALSACFTVLDTLCRSVRAPEKLYQDDLPGLLRKDVP